jgi:prolyl oligopeptidase
LNGYGALNTPFLPYFDAIRNQLWLRSGGTFVLANVRGGGEFPGWHVTGLERRHTYEDFIAVANDLVRRRITTPSLLGIKGLSNGGLLVGTALNMRPDLFAAAVMENPVLDLWIHVPMDTEEYGRWSDPTEREFLLKTSPYHALQPNQKFPKVLVFDNSDDGNFPKAARKYIAKIKSFGQSYLYFEGLEGAHGCGATVEQCSLHDAIVYTYLQQQLMGATNKLMPRSEIDSNDSTRVRR